MRRIKNPISKRKEKTDFTKILESYHKIPGFKKNCRQGLLENN
jgi:hypothetical protein